MSSYPIVLDVPEQDDQEASTANAPTAAFLGLSMQAFM